MQRFLRALLRTLLRVALKPALRAAVPVPLQRLALAAARPLLRAHPAAQVEALRLGNVPAERVFAAGARGDAAILYLHGGGYCIGSPGSHRPITAGLAAASRLAVYVPDYRLAPEHPHPAALDDALAAYRALAGSGTPIVLAGDSAGGGLALALALAARAASLPPPVALLLVSPWVDLECTGESMKTRAHRDPMLTPAGLRRWAASYAAGREREPACSPLQGELSGLPPVLIQTGTDEVLYDDAQRLAARLRATGVAVELREFPGLWHDFHLHAGVLRESDQALGALARFACEALERRAAA